MAWFIGDGWARARQWPWLVSSALTSAPSGDDVRTLTPARTAVLGVTCILVIAVAVLPGLALLAVLLLVAFAIVRAGGYRGRWLALAAAVLAFTLLTIGHRLEGADEGGSSIVSQTVRPG